MSTLLWNLDQSIYPRSRCERHHDILLAVERTLVVVREGEPTSVLLAFERIIPVDDIIMLERPTQQSLNG